MTHPLAELNRLQVQMVQEHLPENRLFENDVIRNFGFIAGSSAHALMLQNLQCPNPAFINQQFYTLLGYSATDKCPGFTELIQNNGWALRYGEYLDFFKAQRDTEFYTTLPLHTKTGEKIVLHMYALLLKNYVRSGTPVVSIFIPDHCLWDTDEATVTISASEADKLFSEKFDTLEYQNQLIVQCIYEGKTNKQTGDTIFKSQATVKMRKPKIFMHLGVKDKEELKRMFAQYKRFNNRTIS
jgi:DNA-binding CsgD family transcriptional regulator